MLKYLTYDDLLNQNYSELVKRFNETGPHYTSYPALGHWDNNFGHDDYASAVKDFFATEKNAPVHLYVHIPFCAKLCYYCICNMSVSNDRAKIQEFVDYLLLEIDMVKRFFDENKITPNITEIHLGGGTPSHLDNDQFKQLTTALTKLVDLKNLEEFAMEIDPRTTNEENLHFFADQGVQRISFGVQDFDAKVQEAINRVQPYEMVDKLLSPAVRKRFRGVNFDLLYGLPFQTEDTFRNTLKLSQNLSPERVSLLRFHHNPEVRKHMRLIKKEDLVPQDILPRMFVESVNTLIDQGYEWVGLDYFAKANDDLGKAVRNKTVWRNFNGFTPGRTSHLIGIGPTSTGAFGRYYSQAYYENHDYFKAVKENRFPIFRGYKMKLDDLVRREVMFSVLCHQTADLGEIAGKYDLDYRTYFGDEVAELKQDFESSGILQFEGSRLTLTPIGRFFMRNVCKVFDKITPKDVAYVSPGPSMFRKQPASASS